MKASLLVVALLMSFNAFSKNGKNYKLTESIKITVSSTEENACIDAQQKGVDRLLRLADSYCRDQGLVLYEDLALGKDTRGISFGIQIDHDVIKYNTCSVVKAKVDSEIKFKCVRRL